MHHRYLEGETIKQKKVIELISAPEEAQNGRNALMDDTAKFLRTENKWLYLWSLVAENAYPYFNIAF